VSSLRLPGCIAASAEDRRSRRAVVVAAIVLEVSLLAAAQLAHTTNGRAQMHAPASAFAPTHWGVLGPKSIKFVQAGQIANRGNV
jgi:hypothetical protein